MRKKIKPERRSGLLPDSSRTCRLFPRLRFGGVPIAKNSLYCLKIKNFGFRSHIYQMRCTI